MHHLASLPRPAVAGVPVLRPAAGVGTPLPRPARGDGYAQMFAEAEVARTFVYDVYAKAKRITHDAETIADEIDARERASRKVEAALSRDHQRRRPSLDVLRQLDSQEGICQLIPAGFAERQAAGATYGEGQSRYDEQRRAQAAMASKDPQARQVPVPKPLSLRKLAAEYEKQGISNSKSSIHRHKNGYLRPQPIDEHAPADAAAPPPVRVFPAGPPGARPHLDPKVSTGLYQWVKASYDMRMPRTIDEVREQAALLADHYGRPFTREGATRDDEGNLWLPSSTWYQNWKNLHGGAFPILPRGENDRRPSRSEVHEWLSDVWLAMRRNNVSPDRLCNLDESGFNEVGGRVRVVVPASSYRGKKNVTSLNMVASGTKMRHLTLISTIFADGTYLPPTYVWKATAKNQHTLWGRLKLDLIRMRNAHPGATIVATNSGWSNHTIFGMVIQKIVAFKRPTAEKPVMLIIDSVSCHLNSTVVRWATDHHVLMFPILPNATAFLQPLDLAVFGPLKKSTGIAMEQAIRRKERTLNEIQGDMIDFVTDGVRAAFTTANIIAGWRASGIWPPNTSSLPVDRLGAEHDDQPPPMDTTKSVLLDLQAQRKAMEMKLARLTHGIDVLKELEREIARSLPAAHEAMREKLRVAVADSSHDACLPMPEELNGIIKLVPLPEAPVTTRAERPLVDRSGPADAAPVDAPAEMKEAKRSRPAKRTDEDLERRYWLLNAAAIAVEEKKRRDTKAAKEAKESKKKKQKKSAPAREMRRMRSEHKKHAIINQRGRAKPSLAQDKSSDESSAQSSSSSSSSSDSSSGDGEGDESEDNAPAAPQSAPEAAAEAIVPGDPDPHSASEHSEPIGARTRAKAMLRKRLIRG